MTIRRAALLCNQWAAGRRPADQAAIVVGRIAPLRQIADELRLLIALMDSPYLLDLRWMNGEPFIHLGGFSNHR
ncbi:immunity 7 family protein [Streptomyces sp. MBT58]|uniref:immunity 7 family protein n=1 Tax=Streptomyces sp. MBT58 TaxID=1488389 RepID=UPI001F339993|nr:immunity 7 family protein [Streptomyces sp. MBT58]